MYVVGSFCLCANAFSELGNTCQTSGFVSATPADAAMHAANRLRAGRGLRSRPIPSSGDCRSTFPERQSLHPYVACRVKSSSCRDGSPTNADRERDCRIRRRDVKNKNLRLAIPKRDLYSRPRFRRKAEAIGPRHVCMVE